MMSNGVGSSRARTARRAPHPPSQPEGLLLINKPSGLTSHDVVDVVRRKLNLRRVGHTGTLDPMAEGLLIVLVGSATRFQHQLQGHDKVYEAVVRFGTQTDTGDAAGAAIRHAQIPALSKERLLEVLSSLKGALVQTPPAYSAVKVKGRPAYWWTRRGESVTLAARRIQLFDMTLLDWTAESLTCRIHCSPGTYVRVLAETIAERLGTVGHLSRLVRFGAGPWQLAQAYPLAWVREANPETVARALIPTASFLAEAPSLPLCGRDSRA